MAQTCRFETSRADYYRDFDRDRAMLPHRVSARKAYGQTTRGKAVRALVNKRQKEKYPIRRAARIAVGNAIARGGLIRLPCEKCGEVKVHAHHDDYSKPLSVRWLCVVHHREHHKNEASMPMQEKV